MEEQAAQEGSPLGRAAHAFGTFVGSITFLTLQVAAIAAWLLLNSGLSPHTVFDPYPFDLLGVVVSIESVILTTFVLIKQNREGDRAGQRAHLDLQINLLSEQEITKVLKIVQIIAAKVGADLPHDAEVEALMAETEIGSLAAKLEDRSGKLDGKSA